MTFLDKLTQAHQAILLFIWCYVLFGLCIPPIRARMASSPPTNDGVIWSILWIIVVVVTFVAWVRLMF